MTAAAPVPYPRCEHCAHTWHGLPCAVRTSVGPTPTCACSTAVPAPVELGRRHSHLWALPDGTGVHAPLGALTVDDATGRLCCHLCGRWFRGLALHVRVHGHTASSYRAAVGLCSGTALVSADISTAISRRQAVRYTAAPEVRERLRPGQEMARDGRLAAASRPHREVVEPQQRRDARRQALERGRARQRELRAEGVESVLALHGAGDLAEHLRTAYEAGGSLESLARTTGLGRARLRAALDGAGVAVRLTGRNTFRGKRSRARRAEVLAARRVGTDDLHGWLAQRREEGWTLTALGDAVGHSSHWVRGRISS